MRQGFSHFLAPNLIEMSKLVGWLCKREGGDLGSITPFETASAGKMSGRGREGAKLRLPQLLVATTGSCPGLLAVP